MKFLFLPYTIAIFSISTHHRTWSYFEKIPNMVNLIFIIAKNIKKDTFHYFPKPIKSREQEKFL